MFQRYFLCSNQKYQENLLFTLVTVSRKPVISLHFVMIRLLSQNIYFLRYIPKKAVLEVCFFTIWASLTPYSQSTASANRRQKRHLSKRREQIFPYQLPFPTLQKPSSREPMPSPVNSLILTSEANISCMPL